MIPVRRLFRSAGGKQENAEAEAAFRDVTERNGMGDEKLDEVRTHLAKALEGGLDHPTSSHVATALWQVTKAQLYLRGGLINSGALGPALASSAMPTAVPPLPAPSVTEPVCLLWRAAPAPAWVAFLPRAIADVTATASIGLCITFLLLAFHVRSTLDVAIDVGGLLLVGLLALLTDITGPRHAN